MKYRGFDITTKRHAPGYSTLANRVKDGWVLVDEYNECLKNKNEAIQDSKITIDDYHKNTDWYEEE